MIGACQGKVEVFGSKEDPERDNCRGEEQTRFGYGISGNKYITIERAAVARYMTPLELFPQLQHIPERPRVSRVYYSPETAR